MWVLYLFAPIEGRGDGRPVAVTGWWIWHGREPLWHRGTGDGRKLAMGLGGGTAQVGVFAERARIGRDTRRGG